MGLYSFVLFAVIVLLACDGSASKVAAANSTAQGRGDAEEQNGASIKSFVRTSEPTDEGDEARVLMDDTSISRLLKSELEQLKAKLATTGTNHVEHAEAHDAVELYLNGPGGAQLAKIASHYRNKDSNSHQKFLNELFEELKLTPEKENTLVLALASIRGIDDKDMRQLATELIMKRIQVIVRGKAPFDDLFALIENKESGSRIFANQEWNIVQIFHHMYNEHLDNTHLDFIHKSSIPLFDIIVRYFKDETTLLKALSEAKGFPVSRKNALKIEEELLQKWADNNVALEDVLKRLHLDEDQYNFEKLMILVKYLNKCIGKQPTKLSPDVSANMAVSDRMDKIVAFEIATRMKHFSVDDRLQLLQSIFYRWMDTRDENAVRVFLKSDASMDSNAADLLIKEYDRYFSNQFLGRKLRAMQTHHY